MKLSKKGLDFIAQEEGLRLNAYQDQVGVWTIGYGSTFYEDGTKVKKGDKITKERALNLFANITKVFEDGVNRVVKSKLNQNQFDALVSIAFNIGLGAFSGSTLLKRVNANPNDPNIRTQFEAWRNAGGKPILLKRRKREADMYFTQEETVYKTTADLHLREGAGTQFKSLSVLPKGTEVNILSRSSGWIEVFVCQFKIKGWVSGKYVE